MHDIFVLLDVHFVILNEDHGALIIVLTAVVRRAENRYHRRERLMATPTMHFVSVDLYLMRSNHRDEVVRTQDLLDRLQAELDRAFTLRIWTKFHLACVAVVHRIRPKQITEETFQGWLNEAIDIINVGLL